MLTRGIWGHAAQHGMGIAEVERGGNLYVPSPSLSREGPAPSAEGSPRRGSLWDPGGVRPEVDLC